MYDALADRSNKIDQVPSEMSFPIGPKNRLLREHELQPEPELEDDEFLEDLGEVSAQEEGENFLHDLDYISHAKLVEVTGESDLQTVSFFQAQVDTEHTSLADLGNLLPNLAQLKLSHSNIGSLRDLGTSLRHLRVLWLNRSGLLSLDGLGSLAESIEELYIAFNHVSDLSPIADDDFSALRILDADSNEIEDLEQVEFVAGCKALVSLTLENNPVAAVPGYVVCVRESLPELELLDDLPVDSQARKMEEQAGEMGELSEVMVVSESIKLSRLGYDDVEFLCGATVESKVPASARPSTATARPGSARPCTSGGLRPRTPFESCITGFGTGAVPCTTSLGRPGTGFRPGTTERPGTGRPGTGLARPGTAMGHQVEPAGSSSDLTFGSNEALCGGISRALRGRKKDAPVQVSPPQQDPEESLSFSAAAGVLPGDREGAPAEGSCDIMTINYDDSSDES